MKPHTISISDESMGNAIGHLTTLGALLIQEGFSNQNGILMFRAKIPHQEVLRFSQWLAQITEHGGSIDATT